MMKWRFLVIPIVLLGGVGLAFGLVYGAPRLGVFSKPERMVCTVLESRVLPTGVSPFPPVSERDWQQGPPGALVTIIEYGDFQCPQCAEVAPVLSQLRSEYPEDFRLVFRHFPQESLHDKAWLAAQAAQAAGAQGQFWSMYDRLYARQLEWVKLSEQDFRDWLSLQAGELGLDVKAFEADLANPSLTSAIKQVSQQAAGAGLNSAPGIAINGQYYEGIKDHWTLAALIELARLEQRQFHECPPVVIDASREYSAVLHTTKGDISLVLFPQEAPLAVNSFVFLAKQGWYDGVPIHRVIPGFALQTGDPSGTGLGGPGYTIRTEVKPDAQFDRPGLVGMANDGSAGGSSASNGSQFFITYAPQETLNSKYTLFGEVVSGMDVAAALTVRDPASNAENLPTADQILTVTLTEK
jgi:cyclophilin family peptidyl-prolyl cis-trans isomerase/protein-disulfide isomerase